MLMKQVQNCELLLCAQCERSDWPRPITAPLLFFAKEENNKTLFRCSKLWIKLSSHHRRKTKFSREFVFRNSRLPLVKYRTILSAASTALALLLTVPPIHLFKSTPAWFLAASSSRCSLQCPEDDRIDSNERARRHGITGTHGITLLTRSGKITLAQAPGSRKFITLISEFTWDSNPFYFFIPVIIQPKQCELF